MVIGSEQIFQILGNNYSVAGRSFEEFVCFIEKRQEEKKHDGERFYNENKKIQEARSSVFARVNVISGLKRGFVDIFCDANGTYELSLESKWRRKVLKKKCLKKEIFLTDIYCRQKQMHKDMVSITNRLKEDERKKQKKHSTI